MSVKPKVAAAGIAGAITTIIVFAAGQAGVTVPADVAAAVTTVVATVAGYLRVE